MGLQFLGYTLNVQLAVIIKKIAIMKKEPCPSNSTYQYSRKKLAKTAFKSSITKLNTKAGIRSLKILFRSTFKEKRNALHHIVISFA